MTIRLTPTDEESLEIDVPISYKEFTSRFSQKEREVCALELSHIFRKFDLDLEVIGFEPDDFEIKSTDMKGNKQ